MSEKKLGRLRLDTLRSIAEDKRKNQKVFHMRAKYPGRCAGCGSWFKAGADIAWDKETGLARHEKCPKES